MAAFQHKGYTLRQFEYSHHYLIIKDDRVLMHCQHRKKLNQESAEEEIDNYIKFMNLLEEN